MPFNEEDLHFEALHWKQFEDVCYDLLSKFNFHSLAWRQGGADKGRDIEAKRTINDLFVAPYEEKWFIECKNYSSGVSINDLIQKISWAKIQKADHFVLMTSSYLTQQTREWINKTQQQESFTLHIVEGKLLKATLLKFPDLLMKHFADNCTKLVITLLSQWISHDILPEAKTLYKLYEQVNFAQLDGPEVAFLWFAFNHQSSALEDYYEENDLTPIESASQVPFDFMIPFLKALTNAPYPIMGTIMKDKYDFGNPVGMAWTKDPIAGQLFSSMHYDIGNHE